MASNYWTETVAENTKNMDGNVKKFFDFFDQKSPTSLSPSSINVSNNALRSTVSDSLLPTNPFLTPSVLGEGVSDARSFFEKLLENEEDLICLDDPAEPPKYSNPFLEGLVDIEAKGNDLLLPNVVGFNGNVSSTEPNDLNSYETSQENSFINETSLKTLNECEIECYFDKCQWKEREFITFRISNIYHLNKFWIVPRYRELEVFMEYMGEFYSKNSKDFRIRNPSVNMYCVVHHNNAYYRAIIVKFIPNDEFRLKVHFFDYGLIMLVHVDHIYHLPDVLYRIPQFAVRASLAYVAPKRTQVWTSEVVRLFEEFSKGKALVGEIVHVDDAVKCLHLNVGDLPSDVGKVKFINDSMMDEGYAKFNFDATEPIHVQFDSKVKDLYIFPTFKMLENGGVPFTVCQFEHMMENPTAFNIVYGQYCSLK